MLAYVIEENVKVIYLLLIDNLSIMTYNAVSSKRSLCVCGTPYEFFPNTTCSTVVFCGNRNYVYYIDSPGLNGISFVYNCVYDIFACSQ